MQYRAMRYVSWRKELCCRKKKARRIGSKQVRTEEKRYAKKEIDEAFKDDQEETATKTNA